MAEAQIDLEVDQLAAEAEEQLDFGTAARLYLRSAVSCSEAEKKWQLFMRAASCIERAESWRWHTGAWERVGDILGQMEGDKVPPEGRDKFGKAEIFRVVTFQEFCRGEWSLRDRLPPGLRTPEAIRRDQQACAYSWAAEEALASNRLDRARSLYRKAGYAWELAGWGEFKGTDEIPPLLLPRIANHWREAARSYFRAAYYGTTIDSPAATRRAFSAAYSPVGDFGWRFGRKPAFHSPNIPPTLRGKKQTDVDRMCECYDKYGQRRGEALVEHKGDSRESDGAIRRRSRIEAGKEKLLMLEKLSEHVARLGARRQAVKLYRRSRKELITLCRESPRTWPKYLALKAYEWCTWCGTSAWRTLGTAVVLYGLVIPFFFCTREWIEVRSGNEMTKVYSFLDAVLFSVGNALTLSVRGMEVSSAEGAIVQTVSALFAYFLFAFLLWIALRSYD